MNAVGTRRWLAIGLVAAALTVGLCYVFGGFVPRHELFIAPAACVVFVGAFGLGLWNSRSVSPAGRLGSAFLWTIAFCILMMTPAGLRWVSLRAEAGDIPVTADATMLRRKIHIARFDEQRPFLVGYVTPLPVDEVEDFLRGGLEDNGWTIDIVSEPDEFSATYPWWVGKRLNLHSAGVRLKPNGLAEGIRLHRVYTIHRSQRYAQVAIFDAGTNSWVAAFAYETVPRWVRKVGW